MKVFGCRADNVILDLEDAVAKAEKAATRALVVEALKPPRRVADTSGSTPSIPSSAMATRWRWSAAARSGWRIESHWTVSQGEVEILCVAMGASYDP
jgi:hypothetical protein